MDKNDEEYKRKTTRIFKLAAVINILINLDGGAVPASLNEIIATFDLSSVSTGLVGALVYLGIATGSVLVSPVLGCISPLRATQGTLILNTCATLLFGASVGQGMLLTVRFFIGVLQAIPMVYFPVWVDEVCTPASIRTATRYPRPTRPIFYRRSLGRTTRVPSGWRSFRQARRLASCLATCSLDS